MVGDEAALRYARRDLSTLETAIRCTPGRNVVVQAGGSLGVFAQRLAEDFRAVYCFEPDPVIFRKLARNVPEDNVVLIQAALGKRNQFVSTVRARREKLHMPPHDGVTHVAGAGIVPTLRLDDVGFATCDLLVLDLEGMELFALHGAKDLLERCRPVVMVEAHGLGRHYGLRDDDLRAWLRIMDYEFVERVHSDEIWRPYNRS